MPPKKRVSEGRGGEDDNVSKESVDDYLLPKTMIARLAKGVLPPNTQIQKDALTAILKSTTVFVNYLANNANDRAVLGNHKTIKPEDVFEALREMEFEHFIPRVMAEQSRYVDMQNTKRNDYRHRIKGTTLPGAEGEAGTSMSGEAAANDEGAEGGVDPANHDAPPAAKKAKLSFTNGEGGDETRGEAAGDTEEDEEMDEPDDDEEEEDEPMAEDEVEDELEDEEPGEDQFEDAVQVLGRNGEGGDTESEDDD